MNMLFWTLLNCTIAFTIAFTTSFSALAADTGNPICIRLEGISIGCVPSVDHPCYINKNPEAEGNTAGTCTYYPEGAFGASPANDAYFAKTIAATMGPIAWKCQTWEPGGDCPPGGDVSTCPGSKCRVWQNPVCALKCTWCIKDTKQKEAPSKGCIVCTRPYCDDEPPATPYCPLHPITNGAEDLTYSLPKIGFPKCPAQIPSVECETSATPPGGGICPEMTPDGKECVVKPPPPGSGDCPPRPPVQKQDKVAIPRSCPWIRDSRTYTPPNPGPPAQPEINHCEPIVAPNRFPEDCTGGPPC